MAKCKVCGKEALPGQEYCMMCASSQQKSKKEYSQGTYNLHERRSISLENIIFDSLYTDANKKIIRGEIFRQAAEQAANMFADARMSKTQLRNFLRYIKGLEIPLRLPTRPDFDAIASQLDELYSYTIYQTNRDSQPYPKIFKIFYESHLELIKRNKKEFEAFVKYISSIMAYMTEIEAERKKQRGFKKYKK